LHLPLVAAYVDVNSASPMADIRKHSAMSYAIAVDTIDHEASRFVYQAVQQPFEERRHNAVAKPQNQPPRLVLDWCSDGGF
jgi:hypothetical protein